MRERERERAQNIAKLCKSRVCTVTRKMMALKWSEMKAGGTVKALKICIQRIITFRDMFRYIRPRAQKKNANRPAYRCTYA